MKISISRLKDKDMRAVPAALARAAEQAKKIAEFYGTELITEKPKNKVPKKDTKTARLK